MDGAMIPAYEATSSYMTIFAIFIFVSCTIDMLYLSCGDIMAAANVVRDEGGRS